MTQNRALISSPWSVVTCQTESVFVVVSRNYPGVERNMRPQIEVVSHVGLRTSGVPAEWRNAHSSSIFAAGRHRTK